MYVDDLVTGSNNISEAQKLQEEIIYILGKGGFALHKWCASTQISWKIYQYSYENLKFLVISKPMKASKL